MIVDRSSHDVVAPVFGSAGRAADDLDGPWTVFGLRVRHREEGPLRVMQLCGEADLATRTVLQAELEAALHPELDTVPGSERVRVVVDLSGLRFCDVHSARMILRSAPVGRLALVGAAGPVERVLRILDPSEVVPRYRELSDATRARRTRQIGPHL